MRNYDLQYLNNLLFLASISDIDLINSIKK